IGKILAGANDVTGAATILRHALQVSEAPASRFPANRELQHRRANLYLRLSRAVLDSDLRQGQDAANRYLGSMSELAARFPGDLELQYDLSLAHTQAGFSHLHSGDVEITADHYRKMVALREALVRAKPEDTQYRLTLMLGYEHYAAVLGSPFGPNL